MVEIKTDHPEALTSPDHYDPKGAIQDNHSNPVYISELERAAGKKPFSYLDLACAGGQTVVDVHNKGYTACGVEGSSLSKMLSSTKWGPTFIGGDKVISGAENWKKYKDVCLFKADITKPFELVNEDGIQKFDIITAWDFLEHPLPKDIPSVIENIAKHLKDDGVFVCLVNTVPGSHHRCVRAKEWWLEAFADKGMVDVGFSFNASPRSTSEPLAENDIGFMFKFKEAA